MNTRSASKPVTRNSSEEPSKPVPARKASNAATKASKKNNERSSVRNTAGRKGWTSREDKLILEEVTKHGQKWREITVQNFPGRSDDSVRNRWKRITQKPSEAITKRKARSPSKKIERTGWTKEEDNKILKGVKERGHKWNFIAQELPGRTPHAIRNRFHRLESIPALEV